MLSVALLVALFSALLAGTVSGLTGFGLALISVPLLLFVYEPRTVVVITAVLSVIINFAVVWDSWRERPRFGVSRRGLFFCWPVLSASLLVALLAAFLAGCVSGLTGFGFALISVPLLLLSMPPPPPLQMPTHGLCRF